jgi:hypothetical protein
MDKATGLSVFR